MAEAGKKNVVLRVVRYGIEMLVNLDYIVKNLLSLD